ncbi:MAG: TIM barrel protein [Candidatus Lokiarchaeota archaeon]|nr:TIM barrel protein [Candidatus Lokiarchaeota archaeon]
MQFAICNEIFESLDFTEVCRVVHETGYKGIELAPFTFAKDVRYINSKERHEILETAQSYNLKIVALHWLLTSPEGMSISTNDPKIWQFTIEYFRALVDFANDLNVSVLVLGSPKQRNISENWEEKEARKRAIKALQEVAIYAKEINPDIIIAFEPLSPEVTNFGCCIEEGFEIISKVNQENVKLHIDAKAMATENIAPEKLIDFIGLKNIAHVHLNEPNGLGPGMENDHTICDKILLKLREINYNRWISVETFKRDRDPSLIAKESLEFMKNVIGNEQHDE